MSDRINIYICKHAHKTITRDRDRGVTPMMLLCRTSGCKEFAKSCMYDVPQDQIPTHEWYKPTSEELARLYSGDQFIRMNAHVNMGGLDIRKIG